MMKFIPLSTAAALLFCGASFAQKPTSKITKPAGRQVLEGHLSPEIARAPLVGNLDDATQLHLAIGLPLRNSAQLDAELRELYDPKSPQYHHFLTPAEFAEKFGASETDYQALIEFAHDHSFKITGTFSDRLLLSVASTAAAANKAFHLQMVTRKRPDGTLFYSPDREPSIDLDTRVLHISGLDDHIPAQHGFRTGSGPGGGFGGSDFRNAYAPGISQTGQGQSVGLFEMEGFYVSDINRYRAQFQNEEQLNVPVTVIIADDFVASATQSGPPKGGCNGKTPNPPPAGTPLGSLESSLDIEVAMAMAPGLDNIYAYEGCNYNSILRKMTEPLPDGSSPPQQLSASWTFYDTDANTAAAVQKIAMDGQTLLVIAGDKHALCPDKNESSSPALPFATVVGGTILKMTSDLRDPRRPGKVWDSETAATDGGGILHGAPLPDYQSSIASGIEGSSPKWRMTPDVAMVSCQGGHGDCGVFVDFNNGHSDQGVGGTSVAAPLWVGYIALASQLRSQNGLGPLGFLNPVLYEIYANPPQYAADFHDITSGSTPPNPCRTGVPYSAKVGYDLVTGLGSPKAQLITDLGSPPLAPQCSASTLCDGSLTITCTGLDVGVDFSPCSKNGGPADCTVGFNGSSTVSFSRYPATPEGKACTVSDGAKTCVQLNFPYGEGPLGCQVCGEGQKWCDKLNPPRCLAVQDCLVAPNKPPTR